MSVAVVVVVALCAAGAPAEAAWEEVARADVLGRPLVVYSRQVAGTDVREIRGVGSFAAPPWLMKNVVDDVAHYMDFMPYSKAADVIAHRDGYMLSYQRISTPIINDRDYTVKITDESKEDAAGKVIWKHHFKQANDLGPGPVDGVVRLETLEGWWMFEDLDGGKHTKATYYIYTNPGGGIPAFLANIANAQAVPDLYKAVGKASSFPRYAATRPTLPGAAQVPPAAPATPTPTPTTPPTPPTPPPTPTVG